MRNNPGRAAVHGALLLALALPFAAHTASEGEIRSYILSINRLYESLDYEIALSRIQLARQQPRGMDEEVTLSIYEGIILCEMGKQGPGTSAFRAALLLRPDAKLPVQVAPKVEALFDQVRVLVKKEMASLLPQPGTENPSVQTGQEQEEAPPPLEMAERVSPTPSEDRPSPGSQQDSHVDKDPMPPSVSQEELSSERFMRRLLRLQGKFLLSDAASQRVPIRELDKIAQHIREAHTPESLQQAARALDDWQQRHLPPPRTAEPASQDVEAGPSPTELKQESHADEDPTPPSVLLPQPGTENPSVQTGQKQEEAPPPLEMAERVSPTPSEHGPTPGSQQDSHADKDPMPPSVSQEELSSEQLLQRLLRLQGKFLQSGASSNRVSLKELDKLAQQIRASRTPESLQEAAQALDGWQQRHLPQ